MLLRAYAGWSDPNPNQPDWYVTTALATFTAFLLVYLLPTVQDFLPNSLVILSEKGINNNIVKGGVHISFIPWDRIGKAVIDPVELDGSVYLAISIYSPSDNHIVTYGVGKKTPIGEIREYFHLFSKECLLPEE